jgi:hypothetical protein
MHEAERAFRRDERAAISDFAEAVRNEDIARLLRAADKNETLGTWTKALRVVSRLPGTSPMFRRSFLQVWLEHGDAMRQQVHCENRGDLALLDALHVLLPPYIGPGLTLFRGERACNRRYRRYGPSWTSDSDVAKAFALDAHRYAQDDGVVLATEAPAQAIISAPFQIDNSYCEAEYVVDRRLLKRVHVIDRLPRDQANG